MTRDRVAAVVVTHNRSGVLAETLRAARAQTRSVDRLYVVDNASSDDTPERLQAQFPDVAHLRMAENLGAGGGFAAGIDAAVQFAGFADDGSMAVPSAGPATAS